MNFGSDTPEPDHPEPTPQFTTVKARYLLALFVGTQLVVVHFFPESTEVRVLDAITSFGSYLFIGWLLWRQGVSAGMTVSSLVGERPSNKELRRFILLGIPLIGISLAGLFAVYLPLSWVKPDLVTELFEHDFALITWSRASEEWIGNVLNIATLVLVAPTVEEILFRGFLLNRWWEKYGLEKAVVLSSITFGILHIEVIGGVIFGLVLSRIYVKTRSLMGPILIHMSNNAIVFLVVLAEAFLEGESVEFVLTEFQAYWWLGPIGLVLGLPWLARFYRDYLKQLPEAARSPAAEKAEI